MNNKLQKKSLKQAENQNQQGRSMVEMLGVLAIIGVLSIGGIAGYRWGMDKHIANQILYEMNLNSAQLAMLLQKGNPEGVTLSLGSPYDDAEPRYRTVDYGFDYGCEEEVAGELHKCFKPDETKYFISALNLSERIANMVIESAPNLQYYVDYTETVSDEVENTTDVTIFFDINANASESLPDSETTDKCESNADCRDDKPYCDTNNGNTCKSCYEAFGEDKPYWNGTSCVPCPSGTWNVSKNMCTENKCATNADCQALKGNNDYYCDTTGTSSCSNGKNTNEDEGVCEPLGNYESQKVGTVTYYKGPKMDWWSAERYCDALKRQGKKVNGILVSLEELTKSDDINGVLWEKLNEGGWSSDIIFWTSTPKNNDNTSCYVYDVHLNGGDVHNNTFKLDRSYTQFFALCK